MSFLTITKEKLSTGDVAEGYEIYFEPRPTDNELPTVWLDLHLSGDRYEYCENVKVKHEFKKGKNDERYVKIRPGRAVRVYTKEKVGTNRWHAAVVVNVVGKIKNGLIIAPGKVDPGFSPSRLLLVVFNQSRRTFILKENDVIASIAFSELSDIANPTTSRGHDESQSRYKPTWIETLRDWYTKTDFVDLSIKNFYLVIVMIIAGLVVYILTQ